MVKGIRASDPRGLNKEYDSVFYVGSRVWQETSNESRRTPRPKRFKYKTKDEDNSPKTLNDKNHHASSQKFRQLVFANGPVDMGSIPGSVILKTLKNDTWYLLA